MDWLPDDFEHPTSVALPTGEHLRPMGASDVDLDYPAVMGSRARLWETYGEAWGWPPASMTYEQDRDDLAHHEREIRAHESFLYGVFDAGETRLSGCVYIDPPREPAPGGCVAVVSWWLVDDAVGTPLEAALAAFVPRWLQDDWPFTDVRLTVE